MPPQDPKRFIFTRALGAGPGLERDPLGYLPPKEFKHKSNSEYAPVPAQVELEPED